MGVGVCGVTSLWAGRPISLRPNNRDFDGNKRILVVGYLLPELWCYTENSKHL